MANNPTTPPKPYIVSLDNMTLDDLLLNLKQQPSGRKITDEEKRWVTNLLTIVEEPRRSIVRSLLLHSSKYSTDEFGDVAEFIGDLAIVERNHQLYSHVDLNEIKENCSLKAVFHSFGYKGFLPEVILVRSSMLSDYFGWAVDGRQLVVNVSKFFRDLTDVPHRTHRMQLHDYYIGGMMLTACHEAMHCALRQEQGNANFSTPELLQSGNDSTGKPITSGFKDALNRIRRIHGNFPTESGYVMEYLLLGGIPEMDSIRRFDYDAELCELLFDSTPPRFGAIVEKPFFMPSAQFGSIPSMSCHRRIGISYK